MIVNFANKALLEVLTNRLEDTLSANTTVWRLGRRAERAEKALERWLERHLAPIGEAFLQERLERARWQLANAEHYFGGYISQGWFYDHQGRAKGITPEGLEILRELSDEVRRYVEALLWGNGTEYVSYHNLPPAERAEYLTRRARVDALWKEVRPSQRAVRAEWRKALGKPEGYHPYPRDEAAALEAAFPVLGEGIPGDTEGARTLLTRAQEALANLEEEAWALVA